MKAIASEEVGERIAQWYSCIITRDFEEAEKLKEEVDLKITNMTEDDKIVSYYQLVDFRYQMLLQVHEGKNLTEPPGKNLENLGDSYLRFMFYFVTGVYEFWQGRYKSAIRSFKVAEMLIEKVNDPLEKAEFYHRLGLSYYRINQYTFSMSYLEQALEYFEKQKIYTENVIMIKSIIAAIYTEVEQYSKAELIYDEIIELSKLYPALFALLRRNFGLHRLAQNRLSEAEVLFSEAIDIPAFSLTKQYLFTRYNLANVRLRLGKEVTDWDYIVHKIKLNKEDEYIARCKVSEGLYIKRDDELVREGINHLLTNELYFEVSECSHEAGTFYKKEGKKDLALEYIELAYSMNKKQKNIGVDQV